MNQFRQIMFGDAMEMIAYDDLENLYFMDGNKLVCIKNYRIDIDSLKHKEYYKKEVVTDE